MGRRRRRNRNANDRERSSKKTDVIEIEGEVVDSLPNTMFLVRPMGPDGKPLKIMTEGDNDREAILAHLSGRMRLRFIRVGVGDRVKLELSPYDLSRGRITWRLRNDRIE